MYLPLVASDDYTVAVQPRPQRRYVLQALQAVLSVGVVFSSIFLILTFVAPERIEAWILSERGAQPMPINSDLVFLSSTDTMTCKEKRAIGPEIDKLSWLWHLVSRMYLHLLMAGALLITVLAPFLLSLCFPRLIPESCQRNGAFEYVVIVQPILLLILEVVLIIKYEGLRVLGEIALSILLAIPFIAMCVGAAHYYHERISRERNAKFSAAEKQRKEKAAQQGKKYVPRNNKLTAGESAPLYIFVIWIAFMLAPFFYGGLLVAGAIFAMPVLSKYHIWHLDYAICFCLRMHGVEDIAFSIGIFPFYAVFLIYKLVKALTAKWYSPNSIEKVMGIQLGFTIKQEWLAFQLADSYSDIALLISLWSHGLVGFSIAWLIATLVGLSMLFALKMNLLDYRTVLGVKEVGDDIPSLVLSIVLLWFFRSAGIAPSEFNIYSLFSNLFSILATTRKLCTAPAADTV